MHHNPYRPDDAPRRSAADTPVVCLLANARCGPYWVDVVPSLRAMDRLARAYTQRNIMPGKEVTARDVVLIVWYDDTCANESEAEIRAEELRRWPPLWQRGLIEQTNPQWLDMAADAAGFPARWVTTLPEYPGMPFRPVSEL